MKIEIKRADYLDAQQAQDLITLLDAYARDPMGGGEPLGEASRANLVAKLAELPQAFSVLCYVDNKPAGLVNCFVGFSTFKCKPVVNIHDVVVESEFRGLGLSQQMMEAVAQIARELGACKLTLEVLEGNEVAKNAYLKQGFKGYELDPKMGQALFWEKPL